MASILDVLDRPHLGKYRPRARMSPLDRIARNIAIDDNGCWLWTGRLTNLGYGHYTNSQAGYPTTTYSAHKVCFELHHGRVPDGSVLDHLCRVRHCVNPEHLEVVAQRENILRSPIAIGALNAAKTHCKHGHEFTPENTYVYHHSTPRACTERVCKTCRAEYRRRYSAKRRGVAA